MTLINGIQPPPNLTENEKNRLFHIVSCDHWMGMTPVMAFYDGLGVCKHIFAHFDLFRFFFAHVRSYMSFQMMLILKTLQKHIKLRDFGHHNICGKMVVIFLLGFMTSDLLRNVS